MAIWPFGRKGKRPRSQMKASDAVDRGVADLSPVPEQASIARKPSRKRSKRDKRRSTPPRHRSPPSRTVMPTTAEGAAASFAYNLDNRTSQSSIGQDNFTSSRTTPMLQKRSSTASRGTLKKRLSKRSAREVQREQEIRAMSSSPPAVHPHHPATTWTYLPSDVRMGPNANSRHADRHISNQSLPMDSRSSMSDHSDSYTYKVNAFAVLTPRPIIRYSENPKFPVPRSTIPSANSMRKDIKLDEEEDILSKKRVAELADDLDAPALRELLERDRRRREKKRQENQERIQRRLQRRAERDREQERNTAAPVENLDELRGRDRTPSPTTSSKQLQSVQNINAPRDSVQSQTQPGSWLRGSSRESQRKSNRFSDISTHVIGNIDDRSIRAGKTAHDPRPLESQTPQNQSPARQTYASISSPRVNNIAESVSDLSRTEISEKRLSDHSGRRMTSWMSIFSRSSPRRKGSKELDAPSSDFSNTSRESFSKVQAHAVNSNHTPSVPIPIPERSFLRTGTVHRSQSKFTEHLGDYPISPPDSRVQSPIPIPLERPPDASVAKEEAANVSPQSFVENHEMEDVDRAWDDNSAMLSQSLASIDSEGSWMSGKFLRRISQNPAQTALRNSTGRSKLNKYDETNEGDDVASDDYYNQLAGESPEKRNSITGMRRASSTAMGLEGIESDSDSKDTEAWHGGASRKPVVRNAIVRAKSREIVLNDISMLDTSMDEEISPVSPVSPVSQDEPIEIKRAQSVDYGRGHGHARQMSAGSAKLLDIPPRQSMDSKDLSTE
ncbi:hypothetical protein BGW36DRAFT_353902 [Talaromyces proteolyticus]|uniref:Uncharacterized protein n=1 Tax=Talaromyces proteolyticus TaxID=1131652 RepID=A0AAD4L0W1_9EURO|nr:uncharacterized protein BGW36DRAFT_353902 [Talaromyces proteolyticus]KAH8705497.1 hypothetical protein BGW36DRAFT_353902 [Talaromyces proteolyticus]